MISRKPKADEDDESDEHDELRITATGVRIPDSYRGFVGPWLWVPIVLLSVGGLIVMIAYAASLIWGN